MSEIVSYQARIKSSDSHMPNRRSAFMDIRTDLYGGHAIGIQFYPEWHYVLIIRNSDSPSCMMLVTIPNPDLEEDLITHTNKTLLGKWEIAHRFYEQGKAGEI